ncbi:MAG: hypothetical protein ACTIDE_09120 [Carnobacterium maltaromaticum]
MKTNLIKQDAYIIANKYIEKYNLPKNLSDNIDDCVTFYESVIDIKGFAWVVSVSFLSPFNSGETDETSYFISDEYERVEFVIGHGGVHLNVHRLIN